MERKPNELWGHTEPTCRVGDLLRRHDPLNKKEHCPQPGQAACGATDVQKLKLNKNGNTCEWMCWNFPCYFWFLYMFLVVHRSQSPYARSLQSKKWMTTHGFAFHTLNIVVTVNTKAAENEDVRMCLELETFEAIGFVKALLCVVLLLRSLANTVCYFERLPPTSWPTKATFRPHDVIMSLTLWDSQMFSWCIMRFMRFMMPVFLFFISFRLEVKNGSVVQMGDTLATEPLAVPRTSDIVQGLPRIDRLFEARKGKNFWKKKWKQKFESKMKFCSVS